MPTRPYTVRERKDAEMLIEMAMALDPDDASDEELFDELFAAGAEPFVRMRKQEIGPERLSVERLKREMAERGIMEDDCDYSSNVYTKFGFRLDDLPSVIRAFDMPVTFETLGDHKFTGEEGVLLLLCRFRSTDPLLKLTWETGRSISAISEAVVYVVEHVVSKFPHLIDQRSFSSWAPHFSTFAAAFAAKGLPIPNLVAFIDGKLYPVCRPGRYQRVLYSGHKRIHGCKTQGTVFPNGIQPFPYGPINGSHHDSFVLGTSQIVQLMHDICRGGPLAPGVPGGLGHDYVLFGDSAYPISLFLWRMYKGAMTAGQANFNADMSPARVSVEWGFGKIVELWPFLDYRKKLQVLLSPVGLFMQVGNVLTNMHTCLYGSIVSDAFGVEPPDLDEYMAGGPYTCGFACAQRHHPRCLPVAQSLASLAAPASPHGY